MSAIDRMSRRRVLYGMLGGAAVRVGLPFLNVFLNSSGTAFASGRQLPLCFGTYFFGLGLTPGQWEPKVVGAGYDLPRELDPLSPFKEKMNIFSGMRCLLDGHPNQVHNTGAQVCTTGGIPGGRGTDDGAPSLDMAIADIIGSRTRFRSIEVSSTNSSQTNSRRGGAATANPAETSPGALYTRIFGAEFKDPNAAEFVPDPQVMARRSALSGVTEQRQRLMKDLGAEDRARLDQYFTSMRELEQRLDLALQPPVPLEACSVPAKFDDTRPSTVVEDVLANTKLFAGLLAHALACGQTQVFNVMDSNAASNIRRKGSADTHHVLTHEEAADPKIGFQPGVSWFNMRSVEGLGALLSAMDGVREGDGTLLDRSLVYVSTDTGLAKVHSLDNLPLITVGRANGRMKTGIHFRAPGDPVTRVGLTVQQVMGVAVQSWGSESNETSKSVADVIAQG